MIDIVHTVAMVSLGCPKNIEDTENILGQLQINGVKISSNPAEADVIIINTCGFLKNAREESIDTINEMIRYRDNSQRVKRVIVAGCMADKDRDYLLKHAPGIDGFLSPFKLDKTVSVVTGKAQSTTAAKLFPKPVFLPADKRGRVTSPSFAYVKIADGCINRCSYCRIPYLRGPYRSKTLNHIVQECESLAQQGVREIILISQDNTRYGEDLNHNINLGCLLKHLTQISGLIWIRLLYMHPDRIDNELITTIAEDPKICSYLDIPFQHVNRNVLRSMNRSGCLEDIRALVSKIKRRIPGINLRSTFITGYPEEDHEAYNQLKTFVLERWFDHLGVFIFSREPNTAAYDLPYSTNEQNAASRRNELMAIQQGITLKRNRHLIDSIKPVLIDGPDTEKPGYSLGRMETQAPDIDSVVHIHGELPPGTFLPVRIENVGPYDFYAEPLPVEQK